MQEGVSDWHTCNVVFLYFLFFCTCCYWYSHTRNLGGVWIPPPIFSTHRACLRWSKSWQLTLVVYDWAYCSIVSPKHSDFIGRSRHSTGDRTDCKRINVEQEWWVHILQMYEYAQISVTSRYIQCQRCMRSFVSHHNLWRWSGLGACLAQIVAGKYQCSEFDSGTYRFQTFNETICFWEKFNMNIQALTLGCTKTKKWEVFACQRYNPLTTDCIPLLFMPSCNSILKFRAYLFGFYLYLSNNWCRSFHFNLEVNQLTLQYETLMCGPNNIFISWFSWFRGM